MADQNELVKTVIQVLHDGERGYADIGEHLKEQQLKSFFMQESQTRGTFARELEAASGIGPDVGGTAAGSVHRVWGDLKANLGGSDHTLLETAEQGEDAAKRAYEAALADHSITGGVRSTLERQQRHVLAAHKEIKGFRDSRAGGAR